MCRPHIVPLALLLLLLFSSTGFAQSSPCPIIQAPAQFEQKGADAESTTVPGNRGIMPGGFVSVADQPVVHGIDVSKWQASADFVRVKECGATFAYVRLSAGQNPDNELEYRSHWSNARAVGLVVGPYHNLAIIEPKTSFESLSAGQVEALRAENLTSADDQANLFVDRLHELLSLDPSADLPSSQLGKPYLPIALDISMRPQRQLGAEQLARFGREVYGPTLCEWMKVVQADPAFSGQSVIIFTLPLVFADYDLGHAPCDLSGSKFWISHRPPDGAGYWSEARPQLKGAIDAICGPRETSRCIFEQYTSWGGFALFQPDEGLDLDRFYGTPQDLDAITQTAKR